MAIEISPLAYSGTFKLLFRIIPPVKTDFRGSCEVIDNASGIEVGNVEVKAQHNLMFVWPGELTQGVEQAIPSAIWLESLESRYQISADSGHRS